MRIKKQVLVALAVAFLTFFIAATASARIRMSNSEVSLLHAVNAVRTSHGLAPFHVGRRLQRAARAHTLDMMRAGSFGHADFAARMARFGIHGSAGENIAWGSGANARAGAIVQMWMESAPHRANLLRARFRRIGIGTRAGAFGGEPDALVVTADLSR